MTPDALTRVQPHLDAVEHGDRADLNGPESGAHLGAELVLHAPGGVCLVAIIAVDDRDALGEEHVDERGVALMRTSRPRPTFLMMRAQRGQHEGALYCAAI
jgi:hypothetical protein